MGGIIWVAITYHCVPHRSIYTDEYHGVLYRVEQSVQKWKYFNLLEWTFITSSSERVGTER